MDAETYIVETDSRSRAVLRGRPRRLFIARENADGSLLLTPGRILPEAQLEYDNDPELQDLLTRAAASPTARRRRRPMTSP